jgi:hypothetical protein
VRASRRAAPDTLPAIETVQNASSWRSDTRERAGGGPDRAGAGARGAPRRRGVVFRSIWNIDTGIRYYPIFRKYGSA